MKITEALKEEIKRLQEAVDQRTSELLVKNRELEIEASLEKVRNWQRLLCFWKLKSENLG